MHDLPDDRDAASFDCADGAKLLIRNEREHALDRACIDAQDAITRGNRLSSPPPKLTTVSGRLGLRAVASELDHSQCSGHAASETRQPRARFQPSSQPPTDAGVGWRILRALRRLWPQ